MRSVIITAITLFALSGAILGFAIGAFTHARPGQQPIAQQQTTSKQKSTVTQTQAPRVTATATATAQPLGCPTVGYSIIPATTGTIYNVTVQAKVKTPTGCDNPSSEPNLSASGIFTRIWLIKDKFPDINQNQLKYPNFPTSLSNAANFSNEIIGGLQLDPSTPNQIQQTDSNGTATWKVTLSPNLTKGSYKIVGLTDWNGIFFNWSWGGVVVK